MNLYNDICKTARALPVDVDYFYECIDVANKAAKVPLRSKKPKKKGIYLTDIPINRALLAVASKCKGDGKTDEYTDSVMMRFIHISDLFSDVRCKEFIRKCDEGTDFHHALLDAAATARFIVRDEYVGFDVSDVIRLVSEYVKNYDEAGD